MSSHSSQPLEITFYQVDLEQINLPASGHNDQHKSMTNMDCPNENCFIFSYTIHNQGSLTKGGWAGRTQYPIRICSETTFSAVSHTPVWTALNIYIIQITNQMVPDDTPKVESERFFKMDAYIYCTSVHYYQLWSLSRFSAIFHPFSAQFQ